MNPWELGGEENLEAWNACANDRNADFNRRPAEFIHQNPFHHVSRLIGPKSKDLSQLISVLVFVRKVARTMLVTQILFKLV